MNSTQSVTTVNNSTYAYKKFKKEGDKRWHKRREKVKIFPVKD